MLSLICVFAGRTCHLVGFVVLRLIFTIFSAEKWKYPELDRFQGCNILHPSSRIDVTCVSICSKILRKQFYNKLFRDINKYKNNEITIVTAGAVTTEIPVCWLFFTIHTGKVYCPKSWLSRRGCDLKRCTPSCLRIFYDNNFYCEMTYSCF